jgi:endonuclease YncB( thermonuclease family)
MPTPDQAYTKLLKSLIQVLAEGKLRAQQAVERERVATYHEVGRLIDTHLLSNSSAGYGEKLFDSLGEDLGIAVNLLREGHNLYRWHPIFHARGELGWTHYRILLRLPDESERNRFEAEAADLRWPTRELEKRIHEALPAASPPPDPSSRILPPLEPLRGRVDTARGVDLVTAGRVLDLGFTTYARPQDLGLATVPAGDTFITQSGGRWFVQRTRSKKARHYTYLAQIERVIDGDTLLLQIQLLTGGFIRERVRLRGIDTPELGTPGGDSAKRFVEQTLSSHEWIAITSTKPDAYDRYLVDVFVPNAKDHGQQIVDRGRYLNQMLLDEGLAKRVDY